MIRLKEMRQKSGLSGAALAKMANIPLRTIEDIERRGDCRLSTAFQLCDALDCSLKDLLIPTFPADEHARRVGRLCLRFAYALNLSDKHTQILLDAARLHDIEKLNERDDGLGHELLAAMRIIDEKLAIHKLRVADVVRCHRGKFDPEVRNWKMAAALRLSDKLDKFSKDNKDKHDAKECCEKSMGKIEKWCKKENFDRNDDFVILKQTFEDILSQMLNK